MEAPGLQPAGENQLNDSQLYFAVGVPTIALVLGMIGNGFLFNALSARMSALEARVLGLETRMETRIGGLEGRMDILIGKVADIDNRLSVLEDRSKR